MQTEARMGEFIARFVTWLISELTRDDVAGISASNCNKTAISCFQPQNRNRELIDILPFLNSCGLETQTLIHSITSKSGSRPFKLPEGLGFKLYYFLRENAVIKLYGKDIANLHP